MIPSWWLLMIGSSCFVQKYKITDKYIVSNRFSLHEKQPFTNDWKDFYLPPLLEVFPELKPQWLEWVKDERGTLKRCEIDRDCPSPTTCCPHPILPWEKICCKGPGSGRPVRNVQYVMEHIPVAPTDSNESQ